MADTIFIPSDRPCYRILDPQGFWGPDDHLHKEGEVIIYDGEPNEQMEPMNEPAKAQLRVYLEKLDEFDKQNAKLQGRPWHGRARSIDEAIAQASMDARRVSLRPNDGGVPLMGARKDNLGIERLSEQPVPETSIQPKPQLGRPPQQQRRSGPVIVEGAKSA